jgi:hypothetical protein
MDKNRLVKELGKFSASSKVTILTKRQDGSPFLVDIEKLTWVETPRNEIEIIIIPKEK